LDAGVTVPVTVTLYVPPIARAYLPDPAALGAAVQTDLAALGLAVEIVSPDWQTVWLPEVHSGRADLFLLGWTGIDADEAGEPVPPDEELLGLLQDARTANTLEERERLYAAVHARLAETMP